MTPGTTALGRSLRHKMGTALYLNGDIPGAIKWFEETLRLAPANGFDEPAGKTHYSLGVLMASGGRGAAAIEHLSAAVRFSPNYVEAYIALGDALRRSGRVEASMEPYSEALRVSPKAADARFGCGMALVRLGRCREARDWFADAARQHPDRLDFQHAIAACSRQRRTIRPRRPAGADDHRGAASQHEELLMWVKRWRCHSPSRGICRRGVSSAGRPERSPPGWLRKGRSHDREPSALRAASALPRAVVEGRCRAFPRAAIDRAAHATVVARTLQVREAVLEGSPHEILASEIDLRADLDEPRREH